MTEETIFIRDLEKREAVQKKSKELGHCTCSRLFECPCLYFKQKDVCHCAGEPLDITHEEWLMGNS